MLFFRGTFEAFDQTDAHAKVLFRSESYDRKRHRRSWNLFSRFESQSFGHIICESKVPHAGVVVVHSNELAERSFSYELASTGKRKDSLNNIETGSSRKEHLCEVGLTAYK